jgi:hypothetical protein
MINPSNAKRLFDTLEVRRLPARLDPDYTARLLGFAAHDIPVLVQAKLLQPLGKPQQNAVKYFAATAIEQLASDQSWLHSATKAVSQHWRLQNEKRRKAETPPPDSAE